MARLGSQADATAVLREVFGHERFRPGQRDAVKAAVAGRDVVVLLPTGRGKSLCYQIPAMVARRRGRGTTVVVSPLIALMDDQVSQLRGKGVKAAALHSHRTPEQRIDTIEAFEAGELDLLYVSPERAATEEFRQRLEAGDVSMLAIDEAHCISQWGHDFRPDYMRLGELRGRLDVPIVALTATATPRTLAEVIHRLRLQDPDRITASFARKNLAFVVRCFEPEHDRVHALRHELDRLKLRDGPQGGRAIVYCATRDSVDAVTHRLRSEGYPVAGYHAGRDAKARDRAQRSFETNKARVLIATSAFGMGVDLPDVRVVVHLQAPGSPEAYYQEAGRAGRDGKAARCVLYFGEEDVRIQQHLAGSSEALRALEHYAQTDSVCRQQALCEYLEGEPGEDPCGRCDVCKPSLRRAPAPKRRKPLTKADRKIVVRALRRLGRPVQIEALCRALRGFEVKRLSKADLLTLPEMGALERHDDTAVIEALDDLALEGVLRRRMGPRGPTVALAGVDEDEHSLRERSRPPPTSGSTSIAPELDRACRAKARQLDVRPSALMARRTLVGIDRVRPQTLDELRRVPGMRESTVEAMGEELLALVERYSLSRVRGS